MSLTKTSKVTTNYVITCPRCGKDGKLVIRLRNVLTTSGTSLRAEFYVRHGKELHSVSRHLVEQQIRQKYGRDLSTIIEEIKQTVEPKLKLELPESVQKAYTTVKSLDNVLTRIEKYLDEVKCLFAQLSTLADIQALTGPIAESILKLEHKIGKLDQLIQEVKQSYLAIKLRLEEQYSGKMT